MLTPFINSITMDQIVHWGPTFGLSFLGLWLFWKTRPGNIIAGGDQANVRVIVGDRSLISNLSLTFDEKQFRLELRKFVSSLDDAYTKLTRVFGDILQRDHDKNPDAHQNERFFASNSVIGNDSEIDSLKSLTQVNIDEMDADAIESAIASFITNNYRVWQLQVWRFNQIAKIDIDHVDSLRRWLDADGRCLTALHELQSYPEAKAIKQAGRF